MAANSPDPSSTNEKADIAQAEPSSPAPAPAKKGFFSRKAKKSDSPASDEKQKTDAVIEGAGATPAKQIQPASFFSLFRSAPLLLDLLSYFLN